MPENQASFWRLKLLGRRSLTVSKVVSRHEVIDEAIIRIVYSLGEDLAWIRIKV